MIQHKIMVKYKIPGCHHDNLQSPLKYPSKFRNQVELVDRYRGYELQWLCELDEELEEESTSSLLLSS